MAHTAAPLKEPHKMTDREKIKELPLKYVKTHDTYT